jgi:hypothetical protein
MRSAVTPLCVSLTVHSRHTLQTLCSISLILFVPSKILYLLYRNIRTGIRQELLLETEGQGETCLRLIHSQG